MLLTQHGTGLPVLRADWFAHTVLGGADLYSDGSSKHSALHCRGR